MSVRVRKNPGNFISNGPILTVWVTHGKFELKGLIRKLFTVKPRAIAHSSYISNKGCQRENVIIIIRSAFTGNDVIKRNLYPSDIPESVIYSSTNINRMFWILALRVLVG